MAQIDPTAIKLNTDPLTSRMRGTTFHGEIPFDTTFMSCIAPNLWQGGCATGLVLPTHINYLVSLYPWERYQVNHEMRGELYIKMYDDRTMPIDGEEIVELARQVNRWRDKGEVLVHCQAGLNRSSLVVAMALMLEGLPAATAITELRVKRSPVVLCNPTFEGWLRAYDAA